MAPEACWMQSSAFLAERRTLLNVFYSVKSCIWSELQSLHAFAVFICFLVAVETIFDGIGHGIAHSDTEIKQNFYISVASCHHFYFVLPFFLSPLFVEGFKINFLSPDLRPCQRLLQPSTGVSTGVQWLKLGWLMSLRRR